MLTITPPTPNGNDTYLTWHLRDVDGWSVSTCCTFPIGYGEGSPVSATHPATCVADSSDLGLAAVAADY